MGGDRPTEYLPCSMMEAFRVRKVDSCGYGDEGLSENKKRLT